MTGTKCRGDCNRTDKGFVKSSSYRDGKLKYCAICEAFVKKLHDKCPCCNCKLRSKSPHSQIEKRTPEGDRAFDFFNLVMSDLTHGIDDIPKYLKYHKLLVNRIKILIANIKLANAFLIDISKYKRQRPDRITDKREKIYKLIDKIKLLLPNY